MRAGAKQLFNSADVTKRHKNIYGNIIPDFKKFKMYLDRSSQVDYRVIYGKKIFI